MAVKLFEKIKINTRTKREREICVFGFPVLQYGTKQEKGIGEKYLDILPVKNLREKFFDDILKEIDLYFDDIYVLRVHSGDVYYLTSFIRQYFKANASKNPIVICTIKYQQDILEIFCPDVKTIFIPLVWKQIDIFMPEYAQKYKNKKIYVYLPDSFFNKIANQKDNITFLERILEQINIDKKRLNFNLPALNQIDIKHVIQKTGLNIDKFIFISPEASCCELIDMKFWYCLSEELKKLGYDIFCNSMVSQNYICGTKTYKTDFKEAYLLASKSRAIIALHSGLSDFLSGIDIPQYIINTDFPYRNLKSQVVCQIYSVKELPNVNSNNIHEYDIGKTSLDLILKNILGEFK